MSADCVQVEAGCEAGHFELADGQTEVHFFETSCAKKEGVDAALTKAMNREVWNSVLMTCRGEYTA